MSRLTLDVSLWDGQRRGGAPNNATLMVPAAHVRMVRSVRDPRALFVGAYPRFAELCRSVDEPGLAIIAVDEATGLPAGIARLTARVQRPVAAIIGRHDHCDLYLHGREELSLRHAAVILEPVTNWTPGSADVRYRVLDLRTRDGMMGEDGKRVRGLCAEGPAILRCGGYTLFMLPLGDVTDWPASADDAWRQLPERVYLDELPDHLAQGSLPRMERRLHSPQATLITRTSGPRDTGSRLVDGDITGYLELTTTTRRITLAIGEQALRDGVLVGRYERCEAQDRGADDQSLSRVHALLIRVGDRVLLVDTASSNGTFDTSGERARVIELAHGDELLLGKKTRISWRVVD